LLLLVVEDAGTADDRDVEESSDVEEESGR
jgi:hypothetical protein